ncbi:MAG: metallophosphoesterase [Prevotella sp.]|nr:metallophosphoesterase [Prevotella sp.]MCF0192815.1 metallophosphoesterase [Prevotella sp.]
MISILIILAAVRFSAFAQLTDYSIFDDNINIFIANDLGRNGYYEQKTIAELMGEIAEKGASPECVVATGDVHHFMGVESIADPLWTSNYENVYSHPELMIPWYPILGNHEYRGNTQACLDYSKVSRRWEMPARYYTKVLDLPTEKASASSKGSNRTTATLRLVFIDTTPLIDKYREDTATYPDACKQDKQAQLQWLDSVLTAAKERWVVVVGHHPLYAKTNKDKSERTDLQNSVGKILSQHKNVSLYVNGHIHNFQHIKHGSVDYITNSSGSLSRKVKAVEGTQFCSPLAGFSILSANNKELVLRMIDSKGNVLYEVRQ